MNTKFKVFEIKNAQQILGGTVSEMHRETTINRTKSASKIHNKIVQLMMA